MMAVWLATYFLFAIDFVKASDIRQSGCYHSTPFCFLLYVVLAMCVSVQSKNSDHLSLVLATKFHVLNCLFLFNLF